MTEIEASAGGYPLAHLAQARELLEASRDLAEVKQIRDVAVAAQEYARARKLGAEAERFAAEIATRAERRIGQLLADTPKEHAGGWGQLESAAAADSRSPREEVGWKVSSRSQKLAAISDEEFERRMANEKVRASADRLARIQRDREAQARRVKQARAEAARQPVPPRGDIRFGDFRDVLSDLRGIDAVITDPPYERAALPLLADLARWADMVLAPEGVLVVLLGQSHLPDAYRMLGGGRPYRWTACYLTPGGGYVAHAARVQTNWKPLLIYGGGPRFADVVTSGGGNGGAKDLHRWGQDYTAFHEIVGRLTLPGQTVADPFMGAGTTLLAALAQGRHAAGCDIDRAAVATARERCA